ncbi:transposase [Tolypothrix sp. VBCCA 56010]|uniref:transposase n=1 Tax=Tolypothrix sp. VBCCA 56010 TaxID=3137731 RepID=UPI003D7E3C5A
MKHLNHKKHGGLSTLLEFHYTPKHASWLNQVEIELSVLSRQCLERRIPDIQTLSSEIAAWEQQRSSPKGKCQLAL